MSDNCPTGRKFLPQIRKFTRSGKIMRRVLKTIVTMGDIGDVMTLANPEVVQALVDARALMGEIKF